MKDLKKHFGEKVIGNKHLFLFSFVFLLMIIFSFDMAFASKEIVCFKEEHDITIHRLYCKIKNVEKFPQEMNFTFNITTPFSVHEFALKEKKNITYLDWCYNRGDCEYVLHNESCSDWGYWLASNESTYGEGMGIEPPPDGTGESIFNPSREVGVSVTCRDNNITRTCERFYDLMYNVLCEYSEEIHTMKNYSKIDYERVDVDSVNISRDTYSFSKNQILPNHEEEKDVIIEWTVPVVQTPYGFGSYGYWKFNPEGWWNTSWQYRRPITINNTGNSNNLTNYTVVITLDTQALISQGKMRSDCGDIRFVVDDNVTLLPHYIYTNATNYTGLSYSWGVMGCNTTNTRISVRIPFIPASSTKTIYMYYGNPIATYNNNLYNIFVDVARSVSATLPSGRRELSCAPYGDSIYCFGGYDGSCLNQIVRYNVTSNNISIVSATLPTGRYALSCAPYGDSIYCFGGYDGSVYLSQIVRYNVTSNNVTIMSATLPSGRYALSCVPHGDSIYCFGGYYYSSGNYYLNEIVRYNVTSDTRTTMSATLPSGRDRLSCAPYGDSIYCFGGYNNGFINQIVRYNVTSNNVTIMSATLPSGRERLSCAPYGDSIYCFGGNDASYLKQIVRYNVTSDTRTTMSATLPSGRNDLSCAPYGDSIYCFGGWTGSSYLNQIVRFAMNFSNPEPKTSIGSEETSGSGGNEYSVNLSDTTQVTFSRLSGKELRRVQFDSFLLIDSNLRWITKNTFDSVYTSDMRLSNRELLGRSFDTTLVYDNRIGMREVKWEVFDVLLPYDSGTRFLEIMRRVFVTSMVTDNRLSWQEMLRELSESLATSERITGLREIPKTFSDYFNISERSSSFRELSRSVFSSLMILDNGMTLGEFLRTISESSSPVEYDLYSKELSRLLTEGILTSDVNINLREISFTSFDSSYPETNIVGGREMMGRYFDLTGIQESRMLMKDLYREIFGTTEGYDEMLKNVEISKTTSFLSSANAVYSRELYRPLFSRTEITDINKLIRECEVGINCPENIVEIIGMLGGGVEYIEKGVEFGINCYNSEFISLNELMCHVAIKNNYDYPKNVNIIYKIETDGKEAVKYERSYYLLQNSTHVTTEVFKIPLSIKTIFGISDVKLNAEIFSPPYVLLYTYPTQFKNVNNLLILTFIIILITCLVKMKTLSKINLKLRNMYLKMRRERVGSSEE